MKQLKRAISYFIFVVSAGIAGFVLIEHLALLDAIYLTIATVATVGFGDVVPATASGKIFTIFLIVLGVGTAGYTLTLIMSLLVEGRMKDHVGRRTMLQKIASLKNHVIVCGAGRVGHQVISGLQHSKEYFVVIEADSARTESLLEDKIMAICGDAKLDKVLQAAGVKQAKVLVAALSNDADNVYVTLSAKSQNHNIMVVARADEEEADSKLKQAGATTIISPSISGGRQMLAAISRPLAYDFLQNMFYNHELYVDMAEISVCEESELAGKKLHEVWTKRDLNLLVVTIKRNHEFLSTTTKEEVMQPGDILIVIAQPVSIQELTKLASTPSASELGHTCVSNRAMPY